VDLTKYKTIQNEIHSGDLIEWKSNNLVGRLIRLFTKKDVNHTSLCIRLQDCENYEKPHRFILEANARGIELHLLSKSIEGYNGRAYYYRLKPEHDAVREGIVQWALIQVGTKYDYKSLFKNILGSVNADAKRFFCSEFAYLAYRQVSIVNDGKSPRPGEFGKFNLFLNRIEL